MLRCVVVLVIFSFEKWTVNLGRFPFVRTDRPDHSRVNENFTFNQNYPATSRSDPRSVVCTKEMVFQQKMESAPSVNFDQSNFLVVQCKHTVQCISVQMISIPRVLPQ